ncbi:hypothetical protein [Caldivirga sp.]|uniref:hypothetical protein n=1 Tax=Caldivirga sp. TaxID=2080243 RepID=UPI003D0CD14F
MNSEELARLMEVLENTIIVKLNDDYAVRIMDYVGPGEHDYTIVPILYRLNNIKILEVWIEIDARQYRAALISEVDEHLKAVGGWLARGEFLVLFNDGLVKINIPKDSEPFKGFIKPG